jgi:hypothetical protein
MDINLFNSYKKELEDLNETFESYFTEFEQEMLIESVKLKDALTSQVKLQLVFETFCSKAKKLQSFIEEEMDNAFSEALIKITSDNYKDIKISEARETAKADIAYRKYRRLNIEATGLVNDAKAALETVTTRRYVMNSMTNSIVASVENTIL